MILDETFFLPSQPMEEHKVFELSNGIKCVFQYTESPAGHFGIILKAGTRFENESQQGIAHFIEHCVFKGTKKRKVFHVLNRLDVVGGELNAYTTKEEICIYASFLQNHLTRSVELISDIVFDSVYPAKELEKEKDIVIDEILSYKDSPSEQIFDDFESYLFENHPLEKPILGTEESVKSFSKADLDKYWQNILHPENIVISVVGNYTENRVKSLLEKHLADKPLNGVPMKNNSTWDYKPFEKSFKESQYQTHTIIGGPANALDDPNRRAMILLNNILGGPTLNARLILGIREKYGYTYNIESSFTPYIDAGLIQIYYGADPKFVNKTDKLVKKELDKLKNKPLGVLQLHQAKEQLKGQIALAQENKSNVMLSLGKSLLAFGKIDSLQQVYADIDTISAQDLLQLSNQVFDSNKLSVLRFEADD